MDFARDGTVIVGFAIAVITFLVLARKHIARPFGHWLHKQMAEFVSETIGPDLTTIRHEVTANDGSSLKDLVKKNHAETLRLSRVTDERVSVLETNHVQILDRLDSLSSQGATDTAKVIYKLDNPTEE